MKKKNKQPRSTDSVTATADALQRFQSLLPAPDFQLLLDELQRPLYQAVRVNVLKNSDPAAAMERWANLYNWVTRPIPYCETGWWVTGTPQPVSQPVEHRLGYYYIQDAASMLPVSLFRIQPGARLLVLDMAASPGGKTTHLVDRIRDRGLVLANDSGRDRIMMLRLVLQNWGALNTAVTRFPGEKFGQWFPDTFDMVLLDAPCSMQNLRSTEARPMQSISERERLTLSSRQQRLLWSALQAVKVGGQVVYATCSLDPQEDELVLDAVLKRAGQAVQIEPVSGLLPVAAPALGSFADQDLRTDFEPQVRNALRLWPHLLNTSGFFTALLTKNQPLPVEQEAPPRIRSSADLKLLRDRELHQVADSLLQAYGFNFQTVLEEHELALWRHQNVLYAIPEAWWRYFGQLPFQAAGMRVAEEDGGLVPSHEWVARFGDQFKCGIYRIDAEQAAAWLRGEDLPIDAAQSAVAGTIVAVRDELDRLYGRGKVTPTRLRNLLPSRWVSF